MHRRTYRALTRASVVVGLWACLSLAGCSTPTRTVVVDAIADEAVLHDREAGYAYILKPGESGIPPDNLRFREFAGQVEAILKDKGYRRLDADQPVPADAAVVYLTYGVGTPRTVTRVYSTPVYGYTGGDRYRYRQTQVGPDGRIETSGHVFEEPAWDRIGTDVRTDTATYYQLFLNLDAFEYQPGPDPAQQGRPIWSVEVTSDGPSDDLRRWLPRMVRAAEPWIGKSSPGQVRVEVAEDARTNAP